MSNEQKHTPGPWHINDGKGCRWIETSTDDIIARVYKDVCSTERFEANSRLIQYAPDMVDALKDAHAHIADDQLRTRIGNLIAVATPAPAPAQEVDLVARGMKWDEADALIRECASQARIEWGDPKPLAVNLMHRIANKAHQDGFRLALSRVAAPAQEVGLTDERDKVDAERYRLLRTDRRWSVLDGWGDVFCNEQLDAAIDAARAKEKP